LFGLFLRQNDKVKVNVMQLLGLQENEESLLVEQLFWILPASE
jgi:hypothetical protein